MKFGVGQVSGVEGFVHGKPGAIVKDLFQEVRSDLFRKCEVITRKAGGQIDTTIRIKMLIMVSLAIFWLHIRQSQCAIHLFQQNRE